MLFPGVFIIICLKMKKWLTVGQNLYLLSVQREVSACFHAVHRFCFTDLMSYLIIPWWRCYIKIFFMFQLRHWSICTKLLWADLVQSFPPCCKYTKDRRKYGNASPLCKFVSIWLSSLILLLFFYQISFCTKER